MNTITTVAVTGLHLGENPQPGPGVIRSLREALGSDVRIVGLAYDALDSSLYAPGLLDDAYLVPYPSAGPAAYLQRILDVHEQLGLDVIIPCLDLELPVLAEVATALAAQGIRACLPQREQLANRSKERLVELSRRVSIKTPETHRVLDASGLKAVADCLGFPFVLKGPHCDAEVVRGHGEAATQFARLMARWGLPILAQRYIEGEEYDVVCLGDGEGKLVGAVGMRKTLLTKMGKAWGAVTIDDDDLIEAAKRVVGELRWRGGCEVELLRGRDDQLYLIEINPRFPAWVYLATAAGVNLPYGLLQLALRGRAPTFGKPRAGVFYVRHAVETTGTLEDIDSLVTRGTRHSTTPPPNLSQPHLIAP